MQNGMGETQVNSYCQLRSGLGGGDCSNGITVASNEKIVCLLSCRHVAKKAVIGGINIVHYLYCAA